MNNVFNLDEIRKRYEDIYEVTSDKQSLDIKYNKNTNTIIITFSNGKFTDSIKLDMLKSVGLMMALENVFDTNKG